MVTQSDDTLRRIKPSLDAIPPIERRLENGQLRETRSFRGLTVDQAIGYLDNLGGHRVTDHEVEADEWRASLSARRQAVGPSYRLTTVTITWEGEAATLERVIDRFRLKAFRAPG